MRRKSQQQGGAKEYIGGLLTEVTSAATLAANCTCLYIDAHGKTDLSELMVVPDDTFILFIGRSGLEAMVEKESEWIYHADTREKYFKAIYDTYFVAGGGANAKKRPYADQHIYVPGDVLPVTNLNFSSGMKAPYWYKGVFECPTRSGDIFSASNTLNPVIELADLSKKKEIPGMGKDDFKPGKEAAWAEFVGMTNDEKADLIERRGALKQDGIGYFFYEGEDLTDNFLFNHADNLAIQYDFNSTLPEVLRGIHPHPAKKYRFFIVASCRYPTNFLGKQICYHNVSYHHRDPAGLPLNANSTRRLARRFSFAAKCPTAKDEMPMNVKPIQAALAAARPVEKKEEAFVKEVANLLQSGTFRTKAFVNMLDRSFQDLPNLSGLQAAIHGSFGDFLLGLGADGTKSFGKQLLELARLEEETAEANTEEVRSAQERFRGTRRKH